jgi:hypothetical protein
VNESPLSAFVEKLQAFAGGQVGIRNPFVIVETEPAYEHRVNRRLASWASDPPAKLDADEITIQPVWLDELIGETTVYNLAVGLSEEQSTEKITSTLENRLTAELVEEIKATSDPEKLRTGSHVVLLLNVGSVYPFTRASELLDELDRRNVSATIGVAFPGQIRNGKLAAFGVDARGYYPAHLIEGPITAEHLQE